MKKRVLLLTVVFVILTLVACASTASNRYDTLFINHCALPNDGSGMVPGTFTLDSGKKVIPGLAVVDGKYIFASAYAKNDDVQIALDEAKNAIAKSVSEYMGSSYSASTQRTTSSNGGSGSTYSGSNGLMTTSNILKGMDQCGVVVGDDTVYVLMRMHLDYAEALRSGDTSVLDNVLKGLNVLDKAASISVKVAETTGIFKAIDKYLGD